MGLIVLALLCGVVSFRTVVMLFGSAILLVVSPASAAVSGFLAYMRWVRLSIEVAPASWDMWQSYNTEWSSAEYKARTVAESEDRRLSSKLRSAGKKIIGVRAFLETGKDSQLQASGAEK